MNYILIEMQTNGNTTAIVTPATYTDRDEAESAFHSRMASAYISNVEEHTVVLLDSSGGLVRQERHYNNAVES